MPEQDRLSHLIRQKIHAAGGFIPFDRFMRTALYEPDLGYYESARVFGAKGDFVTAPEMGPWLALGLADLVYWGWQQLGRPADWTLLEQGTGQGRLLADLLGLIAQLDMTPPARVIAVERSQQMRQRQQHLFAARGLEVEQYASLDELGPLDPCLFFSNELPDAMPVRCFHWRDGVMFERGVGTDGDAFVWSDAPAPVDDGPTVDAGLTAAWPDGYISEWNPNLQPWQRQLAGVVRHGYLFTIDYGYGAAEYYRPERVRGTLLAHLGHQTSEDVLASPGSRDITAHVDFTALARAGMAAGLPPISWMGQGAWLAQSPLVQQAVQAMAAANRPEDIALLAHAKRMLLPTGMGEMFKLLIQATGMPASRPDYLGSFDRLAALTGRQAP